jgi:cytoskeletal protein CcmA (bactofilin family)
MSDNQPLDSSMLNSIIGEGTRFKGEFDLNGLLRIDGDFSGTIRTKGKILIGQNGRAECNIYADTVVVGGMVFGNIFTSEKVIILSTGLMIGNISSPRLIIEEGVVFNGNCTVTGKAAEGGEEREETTSVEGDLLQEEPLPSRVAVSSRR